MRLRLYSAQLGLGFGLSLAKTFTKVCSFFFENMSCKSELNMILHKFHNVTSTPNIQSLYTGSWSVRDKMADCV